MTISSQSNVVTYNGDSVTQSFPVFFYWLANAHLHVTLVTIASGARLPLTEGVDYTATGAGNLLGGFVTTTAIYSAAYQIEIKRTVPIIQPDNYVAGSILPAETVEKDFDYGIMVSQQLDQRLGSIEQSGAGAGIVIVNLPGSGVGVYAGQVGTTYNFKKLVGAGGVTVVDAGTEIRLTFANALLVANNLTDVADRQTSLNNLTGVGLATNEYVLTKDTGTGNAVFKPATGSGGGGLPVGGTSWQFLRGDGAWNYELKNAGASGPFGAAGYGASLMLTDGQYAPALWFKQTLSIADSQLWHINVNAGLAQGSTFAIYAFSDNLASGKNVLLIERAGLNPVIMRLMRDSGRVAVGTVLDDAVTMLQVGGSMRFDGTSRVMLADTQNALLVNRFVFQDSQANAPTQFNVVPNGTAVHAGTKAHNQASIANAGYIETYIDNTQAVINTAHHGAGATLPLVFTTDGVERMRISVSGVVTVGGSTIPAAPPTGTGFPHIVAGVQDAAAKLVDTADINASQVTYAKIQNISATAMLLGRSAAGAGVAQEIPFTTFLQTAGGTMNGALVIATTQNIQFNGDGTNPKKYLRASAGNFQVVNDAYSSVIWGLDNSGGVTQYGKIDLVNFDLDNAKTVTFYAEFDDGASGIAKTIDFTAGQYHRISMTGACTFTFTPPAGPAVVHLKLTQDGTGSRVMTLPAGKWQGIYAAVDKSLSTAAGAVDLLTAKWDGSAWWYTLAKAWA